MSQVDRALMTLDDATLRRVRPALDWLRGHGSEDRPPIDLLEQYLWRTMPSAPHGADRETHEIAWALGDLFERAGMPEHAALCRSATTHEILGAGRWTDSFPDVPAEFWGPALSGLGRLAAVPDRVRLSLASATALLAAVSDGVTLTAAGHLPTETVRALEDRFRWTEEFPWMRPTGEADIPPLHFLHEHLSAQRLLERDGRRLAVTAEGAACVADPDRLWRAVVTPWPRWTQEFDLDALGVMAASLLRGPAFTPGRVAEELSHVLTAKWRPTAGGVVFDRASLVVQAWYQLGVPLGWWDSGRGPADRRPNVFGRSAAAGVFRAVAAPRAA